ncbi:MAG: SPASM domain-containing protein [Candidatus Wallbacteria bacterium]|nr:SPASM domain-containing protein [Candidatus Wallbacteria bacterium]
MKLPLLPNLQLGITDRCNLACYMCRPSLLQNRSRCAEQTGRDMTVELFERIIANSFGSDFGNVMLCWVGEPLLHPGFNEMVRILKRYDLERNFFHVLTFNTNATLFFPDRIEEFFQIVSEWDKKIAVVFSLDANSPGSFSAIKDSDAWDDAMNNIIRFFETKQRLNLHGRVQAAVQLLVLPENEPEALDFYYRFRNFFDNRKMNWQLSFEMDFTQDNLILFKEVQLSPQNEAQDRFLRVKEKLSALPSGRLYSEYPYRVVLGEPVSHLPFYSRAGMELSRYANRPPCLSPFMYPTVHTDGRLTVCCRDNGLELSLGNLGCERFENLWWGEKAHAMRLAHLESRHEEYPPCFDCGNYTRYFINDGEIRQWFGHGFDYQAEPSQLSDSAYLDRLLRLFFNRPDLSLAGRLYDLCRAMGRESELERVYGFLYDRRQDDESLKVLVGLKHSEGKHEDIVVLLKDKPDLDPESAKMLALACHYTGREAEASEILEKLCSEDQDIHLLKLLAGIYEKMGQTEKLAVMLPVLAGIDSEGRSSHLACLVSLLAERETADGVWKTLSALAQGLAERSELLKQLAKAMAAAGRTEEMLDFMKKEGGEWLTDPELAEACNGMAGGSGGEPLLEKLSSIPETVDVQRMKHRIALAGGRTDEAAEYAGKVVCIENDIPCREFLLEHHLKRGEYSSALRQLRFLRGRLGTRDFCGKAADIMEKIDKPGKACFFLSRIKGRENFCRRVFLLERAGHYNRLLKLYRDYAYTERELEFYAPYLRALFRNRKHKDALEFLDLFTGDRGPDFLRQAGGMCLDSGFYEQALGFYRALCREVGLPREQTREALLTCAYLLGKMRRFRDSAGAYLDVLALDVLDADAWRGIAFLALRRRKPLSVAGAILKRMLL